MQGMQPHPLGPFLGKVLANLEEIWVNLTNLGKYDKFGQN